MKVKVKFLYNAKWKWKWKWKFYITLNEKKTNWNIHYICLTDERRRKWWWKIWRTKIKPVSKRLYQDMKNQNRTRSNAFMPKYEEPNSNTFQCVLSMKNSKKKHLRSTTNRIETIMLKDAVQRTQYNEQNWNNDAERRSTHKTLHNITAKRRRKMMLKDAVQTQNFTKHYCWKT